MSNFRYFNSNPTVKIDKKTGKPKRWNKEDCVIRAFSCALNKTWEEVFTEMCKLGVKYHDMPNSRKIIDKYAENNGMIKYSLPYYITVNEFAEMHDGIYIINIRSHVACVKYNEIRDCWDCGNYQMKTYYTFKK